MFELSAKSKLALFAIPSLLLAAGCVWAMSQPSPIDLGVLNWIGLLLNLSVALVALLFSFIALMFDMVIVWVMGESYQWS